MWILDREKMKIHGHCISLIVCINYISLYARDLSSSVHNGVSAYVMKHNKISRQHVLDSMLFHTDQVPVRAETSMVF